MAGNANSGAGIAFRMSEDELRDAIQRFRELYADGSQGMVTWPRFCAFLGYSVEEVRECYLRGRDGKNAYNGRAEMIGRFRAEVQAMTAETCDKKQALARDEVRTDYLAPPGGDVDVPEVRILAGNGDGRWLEIFK